MRLRVVNVRDLSDRSEIAENRWCLAGVDDDVVLVCPIGWGRSDGQTSSFVAFYEEQYAPAVRRAVPTGHRGSLRTSPGRVRACPRPVREPEIRRRLRTTVVNVCRNHHRAARREELPLVRHGPVVSQVSERAAELEATPPRLPYDERAVVVLRYWLACRRVRSEHLGCRQEL